MRYPRIDSRKAFDHRGIHYIGSYAREANGNWRRTDWRDGEALLMCALSEDYEDMIFYSKNHPFLALLKKRQVA